MGGPIQALPDRSQSWWAYLQHAWVRSNCDYNFTLPLELPTVPIYMIWHETRRHDTAHRWLQGVVTQELRPRDDFVPKGTMGGQSPLCILPIDDVHTGWTDQGRCRLFIA
jgi:hypothetical protein